MSQMIEGPRKTYIAAAAIGVNLRVKITDGTTAPPTINVAGVSDPSIGVTESYQAAAGPITILLANAQGTRKMHATGAITSGNSVYAAAAGKVASSGTVVEGKAMETTTATGDIFEVLGTHNSDISTAIVGTTATAFEVDTDSSAPKIKLLAAFGGSGNFTTTLTTEATLSGDTTMTVPEVTSTLACLGLAQTFTTVNTMADGIDLAFGGSDDVVLRFSLADATDPAFVVALDDTSQQMHITDKAAVATDWARSAGTHPEIAIHSNTTPITDYLAIGNHDGTTASIDVVGGTTLDLDIAGTTALEITAAGITPTGQTIMTNSNLATTEGSGITGIAESFGSNVVKIGTIFHTTIAIDLTGLNSGGTANDISGDEDAANCHIGQITAARNGTIFAVRLTCLETPATGDDDIDIWSADESNGVEDTLVTALTNQVQITNGGNLTSGTVVGMAGVPVANQYLYITSATGDSNATYAAGKLIIELWGK